jgi:branched-subunit amino acid transport protein
MNTYFRSLYYGIASALVFVGLFGFAIDSSAWKLSVSLLIAGLTTVVVTYTTREIK